VPGVTVALVMTLDGVEQADDFVDRWWAVHVLAIAIGSYLVLNGYTLSQSGQTLGKKFVPIAIIIPFLVWVAALGLISIFGKQRRYLHDYSCSTVVMKIN
jgi:uncharacterized RDD family membrane protein YckC